MTSSLCVSMRIGRDTSLVSNLFLSPTKRSMSTPGNPARGSNIWDIHFETPFSHTIPTFIPELSPEYLLQSRQDLFHAYCLHALLVLASLAHARLACPVLLYDDVSVHVAYGG